MLLSLKTIPLINLLIIRETIQNNKKLLRTDKNGVKYSLTISKILKCKQS